MARRGGRFGRLLTMAMALALLAAACGGDDDPAGGPQTTADAGAAEEPSGGGATDVGVTEDTIKVALVVGLTGEISVTHANFEKGFQAYVDALNEDGGVHGRTIEIVEVYDEQSDPQRNRQMWEQLINSEVFLGVGSFGNFGGAEVAANAGIPVIGPNYDPGWHRSDNFFGISGGTWKAPDINDVPLGPPSAADAYIMEKKGETKFGALGYNHASAAQSTKDLCKTFDKFSDIGLDCVYEDTSLEFGFTDLGASIEAIKKSGATHFNAAMDITGCVTILRSFLRAGLDDATLRCAIGFGDETIDEHGQFIDNLFITIANPPFDSDHPEMMRFVEELSTRQPGVEPGPPTLNGWTSAMLMHDILEEVGPDLTRDGFVETARTAEPFTAWDGGGLVTGIDWTVNRHEEIIAGTYEPNPELCSGFLMRPDVPNDQWVQVGMKPKLCLAGLKSGKDLQDRMKGDSSKVEP